MPLKIQSTTISEGETGHLLVELVISDTSEEGALSESLHIRTTVPLGDDSFLPKIQDTVLSKTKTLIENIQKETLEKWNSR